LVWVVFDVQIYLEFAIAELGQIWYIGPETALPHERGHSLRIGMIFRGFYFVLQRERAFLVYNGFAIPID
jgi:hypothetical protein